MNEQQKRNTEILKRFGIVSTGVGAVTASMSASALDVSTALAGTDAQANIETGAVWVLGIAVVIFSARKVIGFFSR